jgi:BASS family bile acid:Na+ symporter
MGGWKLQLVKALATAAIALIGFSVGLRARPADVSWLWRRPALLGRSLLASVVVMPFVVLLLVQLFPLPPATRIGLLMLSIVPAAPLALGKSAKQGGQGEYAISLQVTLILLMVLTIPLLEWVLGSLLHQSLAVGALQATVKAFVTQIIPLGVGLLVAYQRPEEAQRIARVTSKISNGLLLGLIVLLLLVSARAMLALGAVSYFAMAMAAALAVLVGHALGGPAPETRRSLAVFTAMRHPGLAVLLVTLNAPGVKAAPAILGYAILASVVLALYGRLAGARSGAPRGGRLPAAGHPRPRIVAG